MPTKEELREAYDYQDGSLIRRSTGNRIKGENRAGYRSVRLKGRYYRLHRLIWVWHNGAIPSYLWVDHKDRNRANNAIENLRLVTPSQNALNRNPSERHWRGCNGLHWQSAVGMYRAVIKKEGKATYLGQSKDPHRLIWLIHLYRAGIYNPRARVKAEVPLLRRLEMDKCAYCSAELNTDRRSLQLGGKWFYFCPTNAASIVHDCVNDYVKLLNSRSRRFNDANLQSRRVPERSVIRTSNSSRVTPPSR